MREQVGRSLSVTRRKQVSGWLEDLLEGVWFIPSFQGSARTSGEGQEPRAPMHPTSPARCSLPRSPILLCTSQEAPPSCLEPVCAALRLDRLPSSWGQPQLGTEQGALPSVQGPNGLAG